MIITGSEDKVSQEEIADALNTKLESIPAAFVKFYQQNNGGDLEEENEIFLTSFLPIKKGVLTIELLINNFKDSRIEIGKKIPFGNDGVGNIFFLDINNNKIYLFLHEEENNRSPNFELICDSFDELLEIIGAL